MNIVLVGRLISPKFLLHSPEQTRINEVLPTPFSPVIIKFSKALRDNERDSISAGVVLRPSCAGHSTVKLVILTVSSVEGIAKIKKWSII